MAVYIGTCIVLVSVFYSIISQPSPTPIDSIKVKIIVMNINVHVQCYFLGWCYVVRTLGYCDTVILISVSP